MKSTMLSTYVDETLLGKLERVAKADDRTMSWLIAQACREFVAKPENVQKWDSKNNILPITASSKPDARQVDLEDAIAAAVKKGPVKAAKHK